MPTGSKAASRSPLQADAMLTHAALVLLAMRYLDAKGFNVILAEPGFRKERPDAIGFSSGFSCLIECKATRKDFLKDRGKPFRMDPALGVSTVRIYLTNPGVCTPDEVPDRWMLLEAADEDTIIVRKGERSCLEGGCFQMGLGWYFPEKVTTDTVPALINRWRSGFYYNHIDSANRLDEAEEKVKALETQLDTYKTALESLSTKADDNSNH